MCVHFIYNSNCLNSYFLQFSHTTFNCVPPFPHHYDPNPLPVVLSLHQGLTKFLPLVPGKLSDSCIYTSGHRHTQPMQIRRKDKAYYRKLLDRYFGTNHALSEENTLTMAQYATSEPSVNHAWNVTTSTGGVSGRSQSQRWMMPPFSQMLLPPQNMTQNASQTQLYKQSQEFMESANDCVDSDRTEVSEKCCCGLVL